jgi:hypothetical protein
MRNRFSFPATSFDSMRHYGRHRESVVATCMHSVPELSSTGPLEPSGQRREAQVVGVGPQDNLHKEI